MNETLIYLDPESPLNLQSQTRQKLVDSILNGTFPSGSRLPSSRKLAEQLGVARNTVVLASGPDIAAVLLGENNYGLITWAAVAGLVLSLLFVLYPARLQDRA